IVQPDPFDQDTQPEPDGVAGQVAPNEVMAGCRAAPGRRPDRVDPGCVVQLAQPGLDSAHLTSVVATRIVAFGRPAVRSGKCRTPPAGASPCPPRPAPDRFAAGSSSGSAPSPSAVSAWPTCSLHGPPQPAPTPTPR